MAVAKTRSCQTSKGTKVHAVPECSMDSLAQAQAESSPVHGGHVAQSGRLCEDQRGWL